MESCRSNDFYGGEDDSYRQILCNFHGAFQCVTRQKVKCDDINWSNMIILSAVVGGFMATSLFPASGDKDIELSELYGRRKDGCVFRYTYLIYYVCSSVFLKMKISIRYRRGA